MWICPLLVGSKRAEIALGQHRRDHGAITRVLQWTGSQSQHHNATKATRCQQTRERGFPHAHQRTRDNRTTLNERKERKVSPPPMSKTNITAQSSVAKNRSSSAVLISFNSHEVDLLHSFERVCRFVASFRTSGILVLQLQSLSRASCASEVPRGYLLQDQQSINKTMFTTSDSTEIVAQVLVQVVGRAGSLVVGRLRCNDYPWEILVSPSKY
jgi:hypothetical protein